MRELLLSPSIHAPTGQPIPLTAMSFHAATCTLALGNRTGELSVWRVNPRNHNPDENISCYPLTPWSYIGPERPRGAPSPEHEVATVQHDGDKFVFAARSGVFRVIWLGELPDEGMPFGVYTSGQSVRRTSPFDAPAATLSMGIGCNVRLYVSTVEFRGHTLVADGFDNQVLVLHFGFGSEEE
uniref:Uncharacterized protein n=1 Tax=Prymnesium polylepis TaxID=72548 RepID=A0A7S4MF47_9EUKA